jgi:ATP-dependent DNA helicase RecG
MDREEAIRQVHAPQDQAKLDIALRRLKFEELFFIQMQLLKQKQMLQQSLKGNVFGHVGEHFNTFYSGPSTLRAYRCPEARVKEIRKDMGTGPDEPAGAGRCGQRQDVGRCSAC